jgi:hypothetical protein
MSDDTSSTGGAGTAAALAAVNRLAGRVDQIENGLHDLAADVAELGAEGAPAAPVRAFWWPYLDRPDAATAWAKLGAWVREVLLPRHKEHSRTLRACWRLHPEVVDELTALRVVWLDAYTNPTCNPSAVTEYLRRWLPDGMTAIERYFAADGCTAGIHSAHVESDLRPGKQWDGAQVADFITTDGADRTVPPTPEPTSHIGNRE